MLADRGDGELWRHSRLRWLNSTRESVTNRLKVYTAMSLTDNRVSCLGREVSFDRQTALPSSIDSWGQEVWLPPVRFLSSVQLREKEAERDDRSDGAIRRKNIGYLEGGRR